MIIRKKYLFYILAFSSSLLSALVASIDTIISIRYIPNPWAFGFSCFLVGIIISLVIIIILSIPIRKKPLGTRIIDPSFSRLRIIKKQEVKFHLLAGLGNAILTLGYMMLLALFGDPSTVLPFSQIVILYLILIESFSEKNIPTLSEIQSSIIVTFGAILGSISLTGTISLEALAVVFLVVNPGWVLFSIYQRKLKLLKINNHPNDALNIRFWNVIFACLFTGILVLCYDLIFGTTNFTESIQMSITHFNWLALTMGITFFSYTLYIRALGIGKASVTQAVRSSIVLFSIPFSLLLATYGIIAPLTSDPVLLLIKLIGTTLVLLGIISFALTLVKAYVFVTIKPGASIPETMQKLWNIKGVTRVAVTAGPSDFIVKIHIRTLVKGYENIIKKLNEIEAIQNYTWQSVLKEWEEI